MHSVILSLLLACAGGPEAPAPSAAPPLAWPERFALVRADLDLLATAQQAKDAEACLNQWRIAYREHFEPLIEVPLRGGPQDGAILAVEYDFGRLREAIDSPRPAPTQAALEALRLALGELEQQAATLPPPG